MPDFTATLELTVAADSPEDAAREAEAMISDPARGGFVWDILPGDAGPQDEPTTVDTEAETSPDYELVDDGSAGLGRLRRRA